MSRGLGDVYKRQDIYCSILRIKWFNIASQALLPDRTIIIKSIKECMNGEMQAYEEYV